MKRYYLVTFSWTAGELSRVEEYKVFTDTKEPLRGGLQELCSLSVDNFNEQLDEQVIFICN